ncbi:hypothetical protein [Streptomyces sp. NPDC058092]|uniref:hypothetical protein n=1 Tax=Streptomyces sp. NPDC058092 TaxID=3346336 RepID=UPI0036E20381
MRYELRHAEEGEFTLCAEGVEGRSARELLDDGASQLMLLVRRERRRQLVVGRFGRDRAASEDGRALRPLCHRSDPAYLWVSLTGI